MPQSDPASLARELLTTAWLLLPLVAGALVHGLCMKYGWLAWLARPIDAGARWRGRPIFGPSKTLRGPVCVAAGTAAGFALEQTLLARLDPPLAPTESLSWWLGAAAGAAAELSELPNSFVKRRLGVSPGATARGALAVVFYVWDQLDLLLGYWLVLALEIPVTPTRVVISMLLMGALHPLSTLCGYLLGMRPTAR
ncbi:MAG TPA: CDP-archaeol synthase [Myxococcota bacterium]|nr:CDP-archaeol synthase [Myxococcota bacterium]